MAYKVFISHSTRDQGLVVALANVLSKFGTEISVAEWYLTPGEKLEGNILSQIEASDCMIVLLTPDGIRPEWVRREVSHAVSKDRPIIPLVEKGTDSANLGALEGKEYIEYDPKEPKEALLKAATYVKSLNLNEKDREKAILVAGGVMAFLLLLFLGGKR